MCVSLHSEASLCAESLTQGTIHRLLKMRYSPTLARTCFEYDLYRFMTNPLMHSSIKNAQYFRCQDHSLFDQLNGGIRAFDLRYSWNPDNTTIGFYHGTFVPMLFIPWFLPVIIAEALLAPNTTLEDVFAGFYAWLDKHPTEALLISMKYESGPRRQDTAALQEHLYSVLNSDQAKRYWVQTNGSLGTLGQARGKMTLLQRFDWSKLPSTATQRMGIPLSPSKWTDNGVAIEIVYNTTNNQIAYIEVGPYFMITIYFLWPFDSLGLGLL